MGWEQEAEEDDGHVSPFIFFSDLQIPVDLYLPQWERGNISIFAAFFSSEVSRRDQLPTSQVTWVLAVVPWTTN